MLSSVEMYGCRDLQEVAGTPAWTVGFVMGKALSGRPEIPHRLAEMRHTQEAIRELVIYCVSHLEHRCFNFLKGTQYYDYYII